jgi:hypothetical protein
LTVLPQFEGVCFTHRRGAAIGTFSSFSVLRLGDLVRGTWAAGQPAPGLGFGS